MKLKNKSVKAKANAPAPVTAKIAAKGKAVVKAVITQMVLLMWGVRGFNARLVEVHDTGGEIKFRALQDNEGRPLKHSEFAKFGADGLTIEGKRDALVPLGTYVNSKCRNAKGKLYAAKAALAKMSSCRLKYATVDKPVAGFYLGDPAQKGMLAVHDPNTGHWWQIEQDRNPNNRNERGAVLPVKEGGKLHAVKL